MAPSLQPPASSRKNCLSTRLCRFSVRAGRPFQRHNSGGPIGRRHIPGGVAELQHHLFDRDRVGHPGRCRPRRRRSGGVSSVSDDHVAACAAARTGRRQRRQHARRKRALPQPEHDLRGQAHTQRSRRRSRDADAHRCHAAAADALRRRQSVPCDAGLGWRRRIPDQSVQGDRRRAGAAPARGSPAVARRKLRRADNLRQTWNRGTPHRVAGSRRR